MKFILRDLLQQFVWAILLVLWFIGMALPYTGKVSGTVWNAIIPFVAWFNVAEYLVMKFF